MTIFDVFPEIEELKLFKNVERATIEKYLTDDNISVSRYSQDDVILSPVTKELKIGIVLSGIVEITSLNNSHKALIKTASRGFLFGIANLYAENCLFPTNISAKTDTEIVLISPDAFREMLESDTLLMRNFLAFLGQKIVYLNKKIISYTAGNTEQKVAYFLAENAVDGVVSTEMSLSDIAVMLDMGRASLYRAFDTFEADKIIERHGRSIKILDKIKLKNIYSN